MALAAVSIGAFEAKTKFSEMLRNIEQGAVYSITRNGKSVAVMQAAAAKRNSEAALAFERIASRAERFRGTSPSEIGELKDEGRKF